VLWVPVKATAVTMEVVLAEAKGKARVAAMGKATAVTMEVVLAEARVVTTAVVLVEPRGAATGKAAKEGVATVVAVVATVATVVAVVAAVAAAGKAKVVLEVTGWVMAGQAATKAVVVQTGAVRVGVGISGRAVEQMAVDAEEQ
jgi:hypothetical protein